MPARSATPTHRRRVDDIAVVALDIRTRGGNGPTSPRWMARTAETQELTRREAEPYYRRPAAEICHPFGKNLIRICSC
jgi:hypothetical protein